MKSYTVYECEITGDTFGNKKKCLKHEADARREEINYNIDRLKRESVERSFSEGFTDVTEKFIKKYIEDWNLFNNNIRIKITSAKFHYDPMASNTHSAPRTGVTNWGGRTRGAPRGYPGLVGRIEGYFLKPLATYKDRHGNIEYADSFHDLCKNSFPMSRSIYRMSGLIPGSGGGGPDHFGYGATLFIDDFPGLKRYFLKQELKR